jgi:superfamily II DNA or RNA helicase
MLHQIIAHHKNAWLQSPDCTVSHLLEYVNEAGYFRETQLEAIETYLFLKIAGENKPLWQLFADGFFIEIEANWTQGLSAQTEIYLKNNLPALALYQFANQKINNQVLIPVLAQQLETEPDKTNAIKIIKELFYGLSYPDFLFSLPMGAGKTFLMAAFIYLDLYIASNEPQNPAFAHNFLVLIPSGLKSSISPSLKTILNFNPCWLLPHPAAAHIQSIINFEVLNEQKSAKKSNKTRNPNAQRVNSHLPNAFANVFLVNAEKVILEEFNQVKEEDDNANDLKKVIAKLPQLNILIDEVHHATADEIKLRQAITYWYEKGNLCTVLGFSGTPYLKNPNIIKFENSVIKFNQIANTVYHYPLVQAIQTFLKKPDVKVAKHTNRLSIISEGVKDFNLLYADKIYQNGAIAKLAIYCGNIKTLEEEIYPFLINDLGINPAEILKYHKGNSAFAVKPEQETEFLFLNQPQSKKRYILLVQVGKEGWDCPSLTGVILSQKGDSPQNMVLQTACRCLRQVDVNQHESAVIWLNQENANTLNKQLKQEQNTSIAALNSIVKKEIKPNEIAVNHLNEIMLDDLVINSKPQKTDAEIAFALENINAQLPLLKLSAQAKEKETAQFYNWLSKIYYDGFTLTPYTTFLNFEQQFRKIFENITLLENGNRYFNPLFNLDLIAQEIRISFDSSKSKICQ